ncbi:MAG TPA: hypothetical protein VFQ53_34245 [Kofleriaceae bacterium]|nr:hypothetical protein [Kofleriaceae bacterium]
MKWWSVVVLAACGGGANAVEKPVTPSDRGAEQLIAATRAGDAAAVEKLLAPSVVLGGLWFPDATCRQQFPTAGPLAPDARAAFAKCLTTLPLAPSVRAHAYPEIAVLAYDPGLEIEIRFASHGEPAIEWIGYVARADVRDALPTITPHLIVEHRIDLPPLSAETTHRLDAEAPAWAWFKLCLDGDGKVTSAVVRETSSAVAARAFTEQLQHTTFRPVVLDAQPTPVCSLVFLRHPDDDRPQQARPTLPAPLPADAPDRPKVSPKRMHRVEGDAAITPDEAGQRWMKDHGFTESRTDIAVCIDEHGSVDYAGIARASAIPGYDERLVAAARSWKYEPVSDGERAVPACTSVSFIYHQRKRSPGSMK